MTLGKAKEVLKDTADAKKILKEVTDMKLYMAKAGKEMSVARLTKEQFKKLGVSPDFYYNGVQLKLDKESVKCMSQSSLI